MITVTIACEAGRDQLAGAKWREVEGDFRSAWADLQAEWREVKAKTLASGAGRLGKMASLYVAAKTANLSIWDGGDSVYLGNIPSMLDDSVPHNLMDGELIVQLFRQYKLSIFRELVAVVAAARLKLAGFIVDYVTE